MLFRSQGAAFVGAYGLGLASVLLFTAPAILGGDVRRPWRAAVALALLGLLPMIAGGIRFASAPVAGRDLIPGVKLALVQANIDQQMKWVPEQRIAIIRTYLERDLPWLGVNADPVFFRRLITMLAHAQGGVLNTASLGNSLAVSHHTVARHLDILEQTFLLRRLAPYFRNVGKRLVKTPKIYLRDSGLLHHLLNLSTLEIGRAHV